VCFHDGEKIALLAKCNFLYLLISVLPIPVAPVVLIDDEFVDIANTGGLPKIIFQGAGTNSDNMIRPARPQLDVVSRAERMLINCIKATIV
jgi:hypothetical protein